MFVRQKRNTLYIIALSLFILSALYGLLIRLNFAFPIESFAYRNFLQSHSHVAFLGWGYLAVIGSVIHCFVPKENRNKRIYNYTIWIILITVSLMLFSFPLVGYKLFSIVLLCLFGVTSYVLSYQILKDVQGTTVAVKLIRFSIYYYLLSSLATWFLAYVLVSQGKTTLYYNTVYFYLHFLYNGFFVFSLFGLLFKLFEIEHIKISEKLQNRFFIFLNLACIPAYVLSILWSKVSIIFNVIGFVASVLQLVSLVYLIIILKSAFKQLKWKPILEVLLKFGLMAYSLKVVIQVLSSFPYFVEKSLALKPFFIIGYLHLFTLAFMSVFIFLILIELKKINVDAVTSKTGLYTFLGGVLLTEFLLFMQGFLILISFPLIKNYSLLLLLSSVVIVVGLILIFSNQFKKAKQITV